MERWQGTFSVVDCMPPYVTGGGGKTCILMLSVFCRNCAECAITTGTQREKQPPLHPIAVQRPFQIWGIDIMELPRTIKGNRYVIVTQEFLTKWLLVSFNSYTVVLVST